VLLAGAGLVGSLLALFLARRGFRVEVFERRPDPRGGAGGPSRSINLAISTRGLHALAQVGLEGEVLRRVVPMRGRMIHAVDGGLVFQPYGRGPDDAINSISRAELNRLLVSEAEASGRVALHFEQAVRAVDGGAATMTVGDPGRVVRGEAVIAADGASSAVRDWMVRTVPAVAARRSVLDYGYKELTLPAAPGEGFRLEREALHIWPRGSYMLIALPNAEGSFTCTLFLPFEGPLSFAALATRGEIEAFFAAQFGDVAPLIPDLAASFLGNPTGQMVTVKTDPWNAGRCLLVGDAAHAIVPFYGQGMNCGFEDCVALDGLLAAGGPAPDWPALFADLGRARRPDCDAIADMAVENFIEMRDRVADPRFQLEKQVEKRLEAAFPGRYFSRYTLVTFTRTPYRVARDIGVINEQILAELCQGLTSADDVDLARAARLIDERLPAPGAT
jgi:kynurenine 3-monooxygenase